MTKLTEAELTEKKLSAEKELELLRDANKVKAGLIKELRKENERLQKERDEWKERAGKWARNWKQRYEALEKELGDAK